MKKLLLTLLLLFSLGFAAQADETPYLSLTFGSHNTKKVQNYTSDWEQTIGEFTWTISKLNNNLKSATVFLRVPNRA